MLSQYVDDRSHEQWRSQRGRGAAAVGAPPAAVGAPGSVGGAPSYILAAKPPWGLGRSQNNRGPLPLPLPCPLATPLVIYEGLYSMGLCARHQSILHKVPTRASDRKIIKDLQ